MLLCGAVAVSCLVGFTGCKKEDGEIPIVSVATAEEYYAAEGKHINLTQDIVLDTSHAYFKESERDLSGLVLNGNGHTITIKGEEGSVGKTTGGLFTDIQDSTVKNLKIVYDINLKLSGTGSDYWFGGLASTVLNSTVENCQVQMIRRSAIAFWVDGYGYGGNGIGGLIGVAENSAIVNCTTVLDVIVTARYFGGLVGRAVNSSISYCNAAVNMSAHDLETAYFGGLVGAVESSSKVYACKAEIQKFYIVGKPQGWRTKTAYVGLLAGWVGASLHDCHGYFGESKDGVILHYTTEEQNNGAFITKIKSAYLVGQSSSAGKLKNLLFEAGYGVNHVPDTGVALVDEFVSVREGTAENLWLVYQAAEWVSNAVDENGNPCEGYKGTFTLSHVEFPVTEIGEIDYWTYGEEGVPSLKPYSNG